MHVEHQLSTKFYKAMEMTCFTYLAFIRNIKICMQTLLTAEDDQRNTFIQT